MDEENKQWEKLGVLICKKCNLKFSDESIMQVHTCKKKQTTITPKEATIQYLKEEDQYLCSFCLFKADKCDFLEHLQQHFIKHPFKCDICKKGFHSRSLIDKHCRKKHPLSNGSFTLRMSLYSQQMLDKVKRIGEVSFTPHSELKLSCVSKTSKTSTVEPSRKGATIAPTSKTTSNVSTIVISHLLSPSLESSTNSCSNVAKSTTTTTTTYTSHTPVRSDNTSISSDVYLKTKGREEPCDKHIRITKLEYSASKPAIVVSHSTLPTTSTTNASPLNSPVETSVSSKIFKLNSKPEASVNDSVSIPGGKNIINDTSKENNLSRAKQSTVFAHSTLQTASFHAAPCYTSAAMSMSSETPVTVLGSSKVNSMGEDTVSFSTKENHSLLMSGVNKSSQDICKENNIPSFETVATATVSSSDNSVTTNSVPNPVYNGPIASNSEKKRKNCGTTQKAKMQRQKESESSSSRNRFLPPNPLPTERNRTPFNGTISDSVTSCANVLFPSCFSTGQHMNVRPNMNVKLTNPFVSPLEANPLLHPYWNYSQLQAGFVGLPLQTLCSLDFGWNSALYPSSTPHPIFQPSLTYPVRYNAYDRPFLSQQRNVQSNSYAPQGSFPYPGNVARTMLDCHQQQPLRGVSTCVSLQPPNNHFKPSLASNDVTEQNMGLYRNSMNVGSAIRNRGSVSVSEQSIAVSHLTFPTASSSYVAPHCCSTATSKLSSQPGASVSSLTKGKTASRENDSSCTRQSMAVTTHSTLQTASSSPAAPSYSSTAMSSDGSSSPVSVLLNFPVASVHLLNGSGQMSKGSLSGLIAEVVTNEFSSNGKSLRPLDTCANSVFEEPGYSILENNGDKTLVVDAELPKQVKKEICHHSWFSVMNDYCLCLKCKEKFKLVKSFFKHIHSHLHDENKNCCLSGYSRECFLLERMISELNIQSIGELRRLENLNENETSQSSIEQVVVNEHSNFSNCTALGANNDVDFDVKLGDLEKYTSVLNEEAAKDFYKCCFQNCKFSSHNSVDFLTHTETHHGHETVFTCIYCGFQGEKVTDLVHHIREHNPHRSEKFSCSVVEPGGKKESWSNQKLEALIGFLTSCDISRTTQFECSVCQCILSSITDLKMHLKLSALKTYGCGHCGGTFLDSKSFVNHLTDVHPKSPKFQRVSLHFLCKHRKANFSSFQTLVLQRISSFHSNQDGLAQPTDHTATLPAVSSELPQLSCVNTPTVHPAPNTNISFSTEECVAVKNEITKTTSLGSGRSPSPTEGLHGADTDASSSKNNASATAQHVNVNDSGTLEKESSAVCVDPCSTEMPKPHGVLSASELVKNEPCTSTSISSVSQILSPIPPSVGKTTTSLARENNVLEQSMCCEDQVEASFTDGLNGSPSPVSSPVPDESLISHSHDVSQGILIIADQVNAPSALPRDVESFKKRKCEFEVPVVIDKIQKKTISSFVESQINKDIVDVMTHLSSQAVELLSAPSSGGAECSMEMSLDSSVRISPNNVSLTDHTVSQCSDTNGESLDEHPSEVKRSTILDEKNKKGTDLNMNVQTGKTLDNYNDFSIGNKENEEENVVYNCNICEYTCEWNQKRMQEHIRSKHKLIACLYCGNAYFEVAFLKNHIRFGHYNKPYKWKNVDIEQIFSPKILNSKCSKEQSMQQLDMNKNVTFHVKKSVQIRVCNHDDSKPRNILEMEDDSLLKEYSGGILSQSEECSLASNDLITDYTFPSRNENVHHIQEKRKRFGCVRCPLFFSSVLSLKKHSFKAHDKALFKWKDCKTSCIFSLSGRLLEGEADKEQFDKRYLCNLCTYSGSSRVSVHKHQQKRHPDIADGHVLKLDGFGYTHTKVPGSTKYDALDINVTAKEKRNDTDTSSKEPVQFNCHLCPATLKSEFFLRYHLAKHGGFPHKSVLSTQDGVLICARCDYIAQSNSDLANHVSTHVTDRRYTCSLCEQESHHKSQIHDHIRRQHGPDAHAKVLDREKRKRKMNLKVVNLSPVVLISKLQH